jgi:hypothetical protein
VSSNSSAALQVGLSTGQLSLRSTDEADYVVTLADRRCLQLFSRTSKYQINL